MSIDIESAKRNAASHAVKDHFPKNASYIGIGSGTTIVFVVEAIKALNDPHTTDIQFVPTGYQSSQLILKAGLKVCKYDSIPEGTMIDVAFDGADEVDDDLNCIKGGGACLYQEKLVATRARKFVCVAGKIYIHSSFIFYLLILLTLRRISSHCSPLPPQQRPSTRTHERPVPSQQSVQTDSQLTFLLFDTDHRKLQPRLLTKWPSIPIEVEPLAVQPVRTALKTLGSTNPQVRESHMEKSGPLKTDQDNYIIDAPFPEPLLPTSNGGGGGGGGGGQEAKKNDNKTWAVESLAKEIKGLEGVLSVGLFCGVDGPQVTAKGLSGVGGQKPVAAYFGMEDGSVKKRERGSDGAVVTT